MHASHTSLLLLRDALYVVSENVRVTSLTTRGVLDPRRERSRAPWQPDKPR